MLKLKNEKQKGMTFIEILIWSLIVLVVIFGFISYVSAEANSNTITRFSQDAINTDQKIKKNTMEFVSFFDSEEDFSSVFKDKFMINSLKCDLHNYECAFNKNTGDEKENIMRTDISVKLNNNKDNRELIISQDVSSFNSEGFSIIKDKKNGDFNFYNNVYESVVKTEHNENIKVKYFFVDGETKTEIKIEECRNNKNCVFISEYTQKNNISQIKHRG